MKKTDLENNEELVAALQAVYEQAIQARRMLLKVDIKSGKSNQIKYNGTLLWLNDLIRRITLED